MIPEVPRFIDLLGDVEWTLADIDNRARAWVESVVSTVREQELQTIAIGAIMGKRAPSPKEQEEIGVVQAIKEAAGLRIIEARVDRLLLAETMALESARRRLLAEKTDQPTDTEERASAQAVVDAASQAAIDLAELRNPTTPPEEPSP